MGRLPAKRGREPYSLPDDGRVVHICHHVQFLFFFSAAVSWKHWLMIWLMAPRKCWMTLHCQLIFGCLALTLMMQLGNNVPMCLATWNLGSHFGGNGFSIAATCFPNACCSWGVWVLSMHVHPCQHCGSNPDRGPFFTWFATSPPPQKKKHTFWTWGL